MHFLGLSSGYAGFLLLTRADSIRCMNDPSISFKTPKFFWRVDRWKQEAGGHTQEMSTLTSTLL